MIFKQLSVQHFKRLKNNTFDFKPGINIIKGENEAGKSTVKLAFLTALFAKPTPAVAKSVQTWGTDFHSTLTLKFTTADSGYVLVKDFQEKGAVLVDGKTGRKYEDPLTVQKAVGDLLGIASQSLFESTAYIDHSMVTDIEKGRKEIRDSLGASLTGAGEDTSAEKILKKLGTEISEMEKGLLRPAVKAGPIRILREEIGALTETLSKLRTTASEQEKGASTYDDIISNMAKAEAELAENKGLYESNKKYYELKDKEEAFKKEYSDIEHRRKSAKNDSEKLAACDEKIRAVKPAGASGLNWIVLLAGGVLSIVLGAGLYFVHPLLAALALISIPLFVLSGFSFLKHQSAFRAQSEVSSLVSERKIIEARIQGILGKRSIEQLEGDETDVRRKLKNIEDELSRPEMRAAAVSPQEYQRLTRTIKELEEKARGLRERKGRGESYLEQRRASISEISDIEESLEEKNQELAALEKKLNVYKLTRDVIEESFSNTLLPAREVLKDKVSEYFKRITGGRYDKVDLVEGTLEFKVYSPEKADWVSISPKDEELSRGTIDQFFLSARLALIDVISQGKKPPIFLDDPFVTFDPQRLKAAMDLLKEISRDNQIFIFTCKDSYNAWADNMVKVSL
jgi:uncharacterized protein YhaN